jgi:hypothetical protein
MNKNEIIKVLKKYEPVLLGVVTIIVASIVGWYLFLEVADVAYSDPNITELWMWSD